MAEAAAVHLALEPQAPAVHWVVAVQTQQDAHRVLAAVAVLLAAEAGVASVQPLVTAGMAAEGAVCYL